MKQEIRCPEALVGVNGPDEPHLPATLPMDLEHYLSSALSQHSLLKQKHWFPASCVSSFLIWTVVCVWTSWLSSRPILLLRTSLPISEMCVTLMCGLTAKLDLCDHKKTLPHTGGLMVEAALLSSFSYCGTGPDTTLCSFLTVLLEEEMD